jgi:hypothetical protein
MRLIAKWSPEQEPAYEEPSKVVWEDGSSATVADYRAHLLDSHSLHASDDGGMECHMYPDIVGEVIYDMFAKSWVVRSPGLTTAALELHDPDATDDEITTELFSLPIVYRANIVRCPGSVRP